MPELPEVETIKNAVQKSIANANISKVEVFCNKLRIKIPENFSTQVLGAKIVDYKRIGKYIVIALDNQKSIIIHLGMSGKIKIFETQPELIKHDHVVFYTSNGVVVYNDPRRFGLIDICESKELFNKVYFAKMGIDPFDKKLTQQYLFEKINNKRIDIKTALLDQSIINGIGNIYASEILYLSKILPTRNCDKISLEECKALVDNARIVLNQAIEKGGSTLRDYQKPDGSLGYFQNMHCVYNKTGQKCPKCNCNEAIVKIVQKGRSSFYCPTKQK